MLGWKYMWEQWWEGENWQIKYNGHCEEKIDRTPQKCDQKYTKKIIKI